ncbi:MAG: cation:proton antiporter [Gammaproteobacteria bacterium]|nr:MAG: cation:proton antiporter [Gammaproteobacteria bacterium]
MHSGIVESFFLIFSGAALLATAALFTRQPLLVAYIAIGCVLGPHALAWVADPAVLNEISQIGIIFLLFLVGLDLQPSKLKNMVGATTLVALLSSAVFFACGAGLMLAFGFSTTDSLIVGIACTFSSTIIGIKLLPTTVLHHRHIGELVVSLLLVQDLIAILVLIMMTGLQDDPEQVIFSVGRVLAALPLLAGGAFVAVRFVVLPLIHRFDAFHEFIFLAAIGWCLGVATAAQYLGLSFEIGAFIAGVALATSPISQYIAESLRPLRDFFLVLFFFSAGAAIDMWLLMDVLFPTLLLAVVLVAVKPMVFRALLGWRGEPSNVAWETGVRLGQASEFSLLVAYLATSLALISEEASHILQGATVLTFLLSTYLVIFRYPSPIAVSEHLRRD